MDFPVRDVNTSTDEIPTTGASEYGTASSIGVKLTPVDGLTTVSVHHLKNQMLLQTQIQKNWFPIYNAIGYQEIENELDDTTTQRVTTTEIQEGGVAYKVNDALTMVYLQLIFL